MALLELEADLGGEFLEDIFPGGDELGSLLDEGVGSPGEFVGDVAGDGEDFPALLQGERLVMRVPLNSPASTTRTPRDRPLMMRLRKGKLCGLGPVAEGKFADQGAAQFEDLLGELAVFARIDDIDAGAEDGDGAARAWTAPLWAMESMPRAMPLIMTSPQLARSCESRSAMPRP